MKTTFSIVVFSIIVFACQRKAVASSNAIIISNKTTTTANKGTARTQVMSAGQNIYSSRCGRCHYSKTVQDYTSQQWENILKRMIPKAKLNKEEAQDVTAYVMEHAKK
jgi:mono/diheme cytochrome c family protein